MMKYVDDFCNEGFCEDVVFDDDYYCVNYREDVRKNVWESKLFLDIDRMKEFVEYLLENNVEEIECYGNGMWSVFWFGELVEV